MQSLHISDHNTKGLIASFKSSGNAGYNTLPQCSPSAFSLGELAPYFVQKVRYIPRKIEMFPLVRTYQPAENLQSLLAVDYAGKKIPYERFDGEMVDTVRLQYHLRQSSFK